MELGKLDGAARAVTLSNIAPLWVWISALESGFVIEAVTEDLRLKRALFAELEQVAPIFRWRLIRPRFVSARSAKA